MERDPSSDRREAERPVEEAGGGESEGFEQAEEALKEAASHGDSGADPAADAFPPERETGAEHGEADEVDQPD